MTYQALGRTREAAYIKLMLARLNHRTYPWLALGLSTGLLCGAWIFQYGLGYFPCEMCYWQRHAHKIVIGIAISVLILRRIWQNYPRLFVLLIILAFLGSFMMAFWHVGVEYKWWEGPQTCAVSALPLSGPDDILAALDGQFKPPACSDVVWSLFGISMAGYNALASLLGSGLGLFALKVSYDKTA